MPARFPSAEWLDELQNKLNSDGRYNEVAKHWEGDLVLAIEPGGQLAHPVTMYFDLWHGKCRRVEYADRQVDHASPRFLVRSQYDNFASVLLGKTDAMAAMLTNRLKVEGNLGYMMRNVPTVLDFVRCAREITSEIL